ICSYNNLMEKLASSFYNHTLTYRQQIIIMTFILFLLQKQIQIPLSCIRIMVDFLTHENNDIRKLAEQCVSALCRIQKPPRIYLEKSSHDLLYYTNKTCPGDRNDNLWVTYNDYQPPKTQIEWEQTCFLDKCYYGYYEWPKIIKYPMNKRERYTKETMPEHVAILYNQFMNKNFITKLIQYMVLENEESETSFNTHRFRMFKGLFRNFGLDLIDHFMEQLNILIHEKTKEKYEGCHRVAAVIVAGMIRGSKHWTLQMLDELWQKIIPFLNEVCANLSPETLLYWGACFKFAMEDLDPRRMYRLIEFIRTLINNKTTVNTFLETSRWFLVLKLTIFEWRIPALWCAINEYAKEMLDHPYKAVREYIANVLSVSLSFDIKLPNGQSTRHPDANLFIDAIRERLHQAIEIYEKKPLGVLGLCAIVLSSPYDISNYVPAALILLCEHLHDPDLIQLKKALSEFRRTHHQHREKFTDDQLVIFDDVLISPNYYV
ncbi:unnamed protein product, partial [Rotaria sordida]